MAQILVRKIDDSAMERLRAIAQERHSSVEALARQALEQLAEQKTSEEWGRLLVDLENFRRSVPKSDVDSTILIRALRDGNETDD